jgi:predicted dehydrogenase
VAENRECDAGQESRIEIPAPDLSYLPRNPSDYAPKIALIGCGGIAPYHLRAYKNAGYNVVALCNRTREKADEMRAAHFPSAELYSDYRDVLKRTDIDVVDIATPPAIRTEMIEQALVAGKHVLSQKPFVTDLNIGVRLVELAELHNVRLAVNQNGRWAPHFSWMREAVYNGLIGEVMAVHLSVHWSHDWTADTAFNDVRHLILFDFGIHWFDMINCLTNGRRALKIFASTSRAANQRAKPNLLGQVQIKYEGAQASIAFDGSTPIGARDRSIVVGTKGTIQSNGPDLNHQDVTMYTAAGHCSPKLEGDWFTNGFHGAMGELLCAIEENREPIHSAQNTLYGLALCFAAVKSSETGMPVEPGTARSVTH